MALRLVFVHGIGGPRRVELEQDRWTEALARGARAAGHSRAAEDLENGKLAEVSFAYYGDLFHSPGAQGGADAQFSDLEAAILSGLMSEVLERRLALASDHQEQADLRQALADLHPDGTAAQGVGNVVRACVNAGTSLLDAGPWRRSGQWAGGKLLIRDLGQVARYLARGRDSLDLLVRSVVADFVGAGPSVVVAHSLGSVVAYEVLHEFTSTVPLLVTLGSPLAMRAVVWPHLRPRPCCTPPGVASWLDFWDRDDVICARPLGDAGILANTTGVQPHGTRVDSDGLWVHSATKYLAQGEVAGPVIEALQAAAAAS
ncbi:alpha/beta hydrolase [Streptomyces chartreusis]